MVSIVCECGHPEFDDNGGAIHICEEQDGSGYRYESHEVVFHWPMADGLIITTSQKHPKTP